MNLVFTKLRKYDVTLIFFLFILVFDLLIFLLAFFGYYFNFVKQTNNILPVLLTLTAFYFLARVQKIKQFWVISITVMIALTLGWFSLTINSYETIKSPIGNKKLMIAHRDVSLGETNHYYDFYLYTSFPGLMKKVNEETLQINTRGESADNLKVLGVENAEWIKDEKVIFDSHYAGETQVDLNGG
jgi:hypothetical protein